MLRFVMAAALLAVPSSSFADDPAKDPPPEAPVPDPPAEPKPPDPKPPDPATTSEAPRTSASVATAPSPDVAHQRVRDPEREGHPAWWIPRVLLFPVRVAVTVIGFPISGGLYLYEKLNLGPRVKSVFFNEDGTVGVFPVAFAETGFGLNAGARVILRRLGDRDIDVTGRASFGGRFRQLFSTKISSDKSWKRLTWDLRATYEVRPKDRFYGIGNGDIIDGAPMMPVDARGGELHASRFQQHAIRAGGSVLFHPFKNVRVGVSGAVIDRSFSNADEIGNAEQLATNFDVATVTAFQDGSSTLYNEIELTYDTRRSPKKYESAVAFSEGWLLQGFLGYTRGFNGDPARYVRYGTDLQTYLRLAEGPRALAFRLYLEGVTGGYGEVSFYDLPRLGGPLLLRGFDLDQYRDRVAGLGSAEYQFDASLVLGGFVFVDVGRVFPRVQDIELSGMRVGFGAGVEFHTKKNFIGRFTVASSTDGGLFLGLSLDPVYETRARVERK